MGLKICRSYHEQHIETSKSEVSIPDKIVGLQEHNAGLVDEKRFADSDQKFLVSENGTPLLYSRDCDWPNGEIFQLRLARPRLALQK